MSFTRAQIDAAWDAYHDNSDYDTTGSVVKVKLFIPACRKLVGIIQAQVGHGDASAQERYEKMEHQEKAAMAWWSANDEDATTSKIRASVRHPDLRELRS